MRYYPVFGATPSESCRNAGKYRVSAPKNQEFWIESPWRQLFIALAQLDTAAERSASSNENADKKRPASDHNVRIEDAYGLISAVVDRERTGHLGAFWVDPRARGTGLGARLFDAALGWLENDVHCPLVALSVTEGNEQAEAMYRRRGFARSGRFEPLRVGSSLRDVYMTKAM